MSRYAVEPIMIAKKAFLTPYDGNGTRAFERGCLHLSTGDLVVRDTQMRIAFVIRQKRWVMIMNARVPECVFSMLAGMRLSDVLSHPITDRWSSAMEAKILEALCTFPSERNNVHRARMIGTSQMATGRGWHLPPVPCTQLLLDRPIDVQADGPGLIVVRARGEFECLELVEAA